MNNYQANCMFFMLIVTVLLCSFNAGMNLDIHEMVRAQCEGAP